MTSLYDIAILGATPAGYAAAGFLAKQHLSVVLVDAPAMSAESPLSDWVPKDFFKIAHLPRTLQADSKAKAFSEVVYHNADLSRHVENTLRGTVGYLVHAGAMTAALKRHADKAGVKVKTAKHLPRIRLFEDHVELAAAPDVKAKILMIAMNRPRDVISDLALPVQNVPQPPMVVAALDVPLPKAKGRTPADVLHVVECRERSDLGMYFVTDHTLHIRLMSASVASGTRAEELSSMVRRLQKAGQLPVDLALTKSKGAVWHPPAGVALELETHVAKRCLLVGTAGGFAESITGQSLYPTVKSAMIAAEIAATAIVHKHMQEDLMRFKTAWRKSLADYLRPPNTSLQMLLPLLFVNQQIVTKFTRALLLGDNI